MTFGFSTLIDALSWATVLLLGLKIVATIVLLARPREGWFQARWSAGLWWASKITPLLVCPCVIALALLQGQTGLAWVYGALMLFVMVAVPIKIRRRFYRSARPARQSAG